MRIKILASGSSGNCTFLEINGTKLLIDVGITLTAIEKGLKSSGIKPQDIDYIFLTHYHTDHIKGLELFQKKYSCPVIDNSFNQKEVLKDLKIQILNTSHDCKKSCGFIIEHQKDSLVYLTDTGYVSEKIKNLIKNKTVYMLESNHDIEMLMNTKRPHHIKMRILGDNGHLSNEAAAKCLQSVIGTKTKNIFLVHLSEEANCIDKVTTAFKGVTKIPLIIVSKNGTELLEI